MLGKFNKYSLESEEPARQNARRSLVAKKDINKGEIIKLEDLTWKRPAYGVSPKYIADVADSVALVNIPEDCVIKREMYTND